MKTNSNFDVIIVGGSYAGLSAAMALGRSLRKVLIVDSGKPCNRQTPHSHNFITHDGRTPAAITQLAREQVLAYPNVTFLQGKVDKVKGTNNNFVISVEGDETAYHARKIILATGVVDVMPEIGGFADCWGVSAIHCPYCHGYEYKGQPTGLLANGDIAFGFVKMIANLTTDVAIFTNGAATFTDGQWQALKKNNVPVIEDEISHVVHQNGYIESVVFANGKSMVLKALYAKLPFLQHTFLPAQLGCDFTEAGYLKVDVMQSTNVAGVFACGDNTTPMRSVSAAVAAGTMAGAALNKQMVDEDF